MWVWTVMVARKCMVSTLTLQDSTLMNKEGSLQALLCIARCVVQMGCVSLQERS